MSPLCGAGKRHAAKRHAAAKPIQRTFQMVSPLKIFKPFLTDYVVFYFTDTVDVFVNKCFYLTNSFELMHG